MSNKNIAPTITMAEAIHQLQLMNELIFKLKTGSEKLVSEVEAGDIDKCKIVVEVFELKQVLESINKASQL